MPHPRTVWLVGHCGFDGHALQRAVKAAVPAVDVRHANGDDDLDRATADDVLLVNRVLDHRHPGDKTGVDLIRRLAGRDDAPRVALVSNYPDAQAAAEQAGAVPGFGKDDLGKADTDQVIRRVVEGA